MELELRERVGNLTEGTYWYIAIKGIHSKQFGDAVYLQMPCSMYESLDDPKKVLEEIVFSYNMCDYRMTDGD